MAHRLGLPQAPLPHTPVVNTSPPRGFTGTVGNRLRAYGAALAASALLLAACSTAAADPAAEGDLNSETQDSETQGSSVIASASAIDGDVALFDATVVHDIDITFDDDAYAEMISIFTATGDKEWITASVTVDGRTYEDAAMRLKGNSSLFGLNESTSGNPEDLPWLLRLDKYVDGQNHQGYTDIVIRSNSTETALNEAVALTLLDAAGLASEAAMSTRFTVNGGETELRLAIEHPEDEWAIATFGDDEGLLYKADSEGDYSYRGDDPDAYEDVFDQKAGPAGEDDNLEPLIEFLDFINNADDATFAAELGEHLDVEEFATYLAFQDLIGNADDINGRGNNSYLYYREDSSDGDGRFTVVSWDLNLAFDTANVGGGGGAGGGGRPAGGGRPEGGNLDAGAGPGAGGPGNQANVLVDRFMAVDEFASLYQGQTEALTELLYSSGMVHDVIDSWTSVLTADAGDLVTAAVIEAEADALTNYVAAWR